MKRYWILFIFVLIGCTENTIQESSTHLQPVVQTNFLTKEEAIEELVAFNDVYYGRIKSNDLVCDIETCCYPITKGNYDNNLLAYVVNYEDDKGFAVISANRFDVPILVRTESGNLDVDRLEDEVARFVGCKTKSDFNISGIAEDESPEEFIYTSIANTLLSQPRISVDTLSVTYGDWNYIFNYGPHVALKWGQKYPFNMKIPPHEYWLHKSYFLYRGLPPVGCSNVAIGQILATIRQPVAPPSTNLSTDWDRLRSISNSNNLSDYLPGQSSYNFESDDIQMRKVEELADFLYTIYVLNSAYTNENGTFSNIYAALNTLKSLSSTYFANATIREYSLTSTPLINCMKNNRPVYCRGEYTKGNNSYGHAWVVDGYAKRERDITVVTQCGYMEPEVRVRRQSAYFFHVNWGYSGLYDGYYYTGIFDMSGRQGFNSQIDTNPDTSNGTTSYSQNVKYISY